MADTPRDLRLEQRLERHPPAGEAGDRGTVVLAEYLFPEPRI